MFRRRRRRRRRKGPRTFRDRALLGLGIKVVIGLVVIIMFLSTVQCTIQKPQSPTFTNQLTIPLIDRRYDMAELVRRIDEPTLTLDSAGDPFFSIQRDIDSLAVDAGMTLSPITERISQDLGLIDISTQAIAPLTLAYSDLIPFPPGVVPPIPIDFVYDGPVLNSFTTITIGSGGAQAILDNNLGIVLDTVLIDLFDLNTFQTIGSASIPGGMAPGMVDTVMIPLTGKSLSNRFRMQVHVHTPGGVVLTTAGKSFTLTMGLTDPISIQSGTVQIPEITKNLARSTAISGSNLIQSATLQSGALSVTLANQTTIPIGLTISIPDLRTGGIPLTILNTLPANGEDTIVLNLAGYTLAPASQTMPQALDVLVDAHVDSSAPGYVSVNADDSLHVLAALSNLSFSSIRGIFNAVSSAFSGAPQALDVPNGFDSAQFTAATLTVEIDNGSELAGNLNLDILGSNGATLNLAGVVLAGAPGAPVTTSITQANLASFLNPIPDSITASGSVTMGDGISSVNVTGNDFVRARMRIESPLEVLFDSARVQLDIQSSSINVNDIDIVTEHLITSELNTTITNHLPAGVEVFLLLSGDSATLYSAPELSVGPFTIPGGTVNSFGIVTAEVASNSLIALDSADVQVLNTDTLYIGQLVTLQSSGGLPSHFVGSDYVIIQSYAVIEYKFNGQF